MPTFERILMVCTGNICRSPVAEALLQHHIQQHALSGTVASAGTHALVNYPAAPHSQTIAKQHGLDCSAHRAQAISETLLRQHDLILVMDQSHLELLYEQYPHYRGKIYKLAQWQSETDIADPYGKPCLAYETMFTHLQSATQDWLERYF